MKKLNLQLVVLASLVSVIGLPWACGHNPLLPPVTATSTPQTMPTLTSTLTPTVTGILTVTPTNSFTPTMTGVFSATPTNSPTPTMTQTETATSTPTNMGGATSTNTPTPVHTGTPCASATSTTTSCPTPTPSLNFSGSFSYTGSGTVDGTHLIYVFGGTGLNWLYSNTGTYNLGTNWTGISGVHAYFDLNGLCNYWAPSPVPGMRYTSTGVCSNPVIVYNYPVTLTGPIGTTVVGPSVTLDDSCSFSGVYGTVNYTGSLGTVGLCRRIYVQAFSDPGYSVSLPESAVVSQNNVPYNFVTNYITGQSGLSPIYVRAFFDVDGNGVLSSGDPYSNLGQVSPTSDGLLLNINFADSNIR